jgi:dipeptidase
MCDTMVALGNATADGSVLFAKNSDRDPNEVHELLFVPAAAHHEQTEKCTYIEIPQVEHTHAVFLCKPLWIWGAEMGANEHGVVIGNEALFAKVPAGKEPGLIGMDFLRLALERASSAEEAAQVIIDLLETYGQSGNCGYEKPMYYHNSYLIADHRGALILETVDKEWALKKVEQVGSISNRISIQKDFDRSSENLVQQAVDQDWCRSKDDFDFQKHYSDTLYTYFSDAKRRECETTGALRQTAGAITEESLFALLRHHRDGLPSSRGLTSADVCMHAGAGPIRSSQSTGSLVARITEDGVTLWATGTSAPCTSLFKPVWFASGLPGEVVPATAKFNVDHLWWRHELLHRTVIMDPATYLPLLKEEQQQAEAAFLAKARSVQGEGSAAEKRRVSEACFNEAAEITDQWIKKVQHTESVNKPGFLYRRAWEQWNRKVKFPQ